MMKNIINPIIAEITTKPTPTPTAKPKALIAEKVSLNAQFSTILAKPNKTSQEVDPCNRASNSCGNT
jgi:hypothetical protein